MFLYLQIFATLLFSHIQSEAGLDEESEEEGDDLQEEDSIDEDGDESEDESFDSDTEDEEPEETGIVFDYNFYIVTIIYFANPSQRFSEGLQPHIDI